MDENDILLVKRLKNREEKAYVFLFEQYYNRLYRFAANYLRDPKAAHDIVQDLFMDLLEKSEVLNITTSVKAYLFVMVRNRCLNFLRNLKIKDSYIQNVLEAHLYSDTVDAIDEGSVLDELQVIVDKMPPGMKEVFRLRVTDKDRPEKFVNRWYAMGLDKKTGICLPGEIEPYIKYPKDKSWSGISLPWMSIGYELKVTPLQILAFYNAIANDGQRMRPRLVKEIRNRGEVVESFEPEEVGGRICSRKTLNEVKDMLEGVVENGTARNIYTPKYRIAGKTGTARLASGSSGYGGGRYRASFVGYFPAERPLYSCIVVIDNPTNGYYATTVSAPVFREIADKVYSMAYVQYGKPEYEADKTLPVCKNGLKEDFRTIFDELDMDIDGVRDADGADWVVTASNEGENIVIKPRRISYSSVPNVKGMGLRDALYVLENSGLKVDFSGAGMVQRQSLQPGAEVPKGSYIRIELR